MKSSIVGRIAAASAKGGDALHRISLPKSHEFVTNSRGQRIHVRTQSASATGYSDSSHRGVVIFLHGLHSHCSRANFEVLAPKFNNLGFHFAALDFNGHGHSDGVPGLIASHHDLIDDAASLLAVLYRDGSSDSGAGSFHVDAAPLDPSTPFFLLGSSMGGAVSLVLAHMCYSRARGPQTDRYSAACRGCILAAPAISIKLPWFAPNFIVSPLKFAMRWAVLPLMPSLTIPKAFKKGCARDHPIWDTEEYISYVDADPATYHGDLHVTTFFSLLDLSAASLAAIPELNHDTMRILAFIDPEDQVTDFAGLRVLHGAAPIAAAGRVRVIEIADAKHDIITNRMDEVFETIAAWLT